MAIPDLAALSDIPSPVAVFEKGEKEPINIQVIDITKTVIVYFIFYVEHSLDYYYFLEVHF